MTSITKALGDKPSHVRAIEELNKSDPTFDPDAPVECCVQRSVGIGAVIESDSKPSDIRAIDRLNKMDLTFDPDTRVECCVQRSVGIGAEIETDSIEMETDLKDIYAEIDICYMQHLEGLEKIFPVPSMSSKRREKIKKKLNRKYNNPRAVKFMK